jgi:hypothetical protein
VFKLLGCFPRRFTFNQSERDLVSLFKGRFNLPGETPKAKTHSVYIMLNCPLTTNVDFLKGMNVNRGIFWIKLIDWSLKATFKMKVFSFQCGLSPKIFCCLIISILPSILIVWSFFLMFYFVKKYLYLLKMFYSLT